MTFLANCRHHGLVKHYQPPSRPRGACSVCEKKRVVAARLRNKAMLIESFGSSCHVCGYSKCQRALDFHHLDETTKEFGISKNLAFSAKRLREEAEKCVLLCANCHREVHAGVFSLVNQKALFKGGLIGQPAPLLPESIFVRIESLEQNCPFPPMV